MDDNDKKIGEKKESEKTTTQAKKRKYSTTKVKTRNILTNLSYARVNELDFNNKSYVLDILTFIVQYLNVFLLDLKLETELEKNMLIFIWQKCLPIKLTTFVFDKGNYYTLTRNNLKFKDVYLIIQKYMSSSGKSDENYNEARDMLKENFDEIRFVFSTLFSKIYSRTNENGVLLKSKFDYSFSSWLSGNIYNDNNNKSTQQNKQQELSINKRMGGKNMKDYKERVLINEFEQKPLKNDLIDVIEVLNDNTDDADGSVQSKKSKIIKVEKDEEINSFVKVKPVNEVKQKFIDERKERKHAKLMKKKKDLEEQLKKNTEQWNLLKPIFKKHQQETKTNFVKK